MVYTHSDSPDGSTYLTQLHSTCTVFASTVAMADKCIHYHEGWQVGGGNLISMTALFTTADRQTRNDHQPHYDRPSNRLDISEWRPRSDFQSFILKEMIHSAATCCQYKDCTHEVIEHFNKCLVFQ